jgi:hypothetical protein
MKTTKGILLALALASATYMHAISSFVELSVGGGWSSLGYGMNNESQPGLTARQNGSYALNAHFTYGLQFTRNIGLGIGVDFSRYGSNATLNGQAVWEGVMDTDGELYNHLTDVNGWSDAQELYMVEIPLALYLRFPVAQDVRMYGQIGVKAGLPIMSSAHYSGAVAHKAHYEPWMMTTGSDIAGHGFYRAEMDAKYDLKTQFSVAGILKIGVEAPVDNLRHVWLFGAVYGTLYFRPAVVPCEQRAPIGWHNDSDDAAMQEAHYFMSDYSPIIYTEMTKGDVKPLAIGVEFGVRFRIPHVKRYRRCNCDTE